MLHSGDLLELAVSIGRAYDLENNVPNDIPWDGDIYFLFVKSDLLYLLLN